MERVSLRAAFALAFVLAPATVNAGPSGDREQNVTRVEPPRITPEALLTALRRYVARVRVAGASNELGFGIVVAQRGSEVVIATAAHVVVDELGQPLGPTSVVLVPAAGEPLEATATLMAGQEHINKAELDLAFLVARLPRPVPLSGGIVAPKAARAGEPVWVVAPVVGAPWSPEPGKADDIGKPGEIGFSGGGVQTGSSGSPLVSVNGVIGLVRDTNDVTSYAVSFTRVHEEFVRRYGRDYTWALPFAAVGPDLGWLRLKRSDDLSNFVVSFELTPVAPQMPPIVASPERWQPVPEGRYKISPAATAGSRAELRCVPDAIEIRAFAERQLDLACQGNFAGDWIGPSGKLRFTVIDDDRYSVSELDAFGREAGLGIATVIGPMLSLAMNGRITGPWSAKLTHEPGELHGERRIAGTGAREELRWLRAF